MPSPAPNLVRPRPIAPVAAETAAEGATDWQTAGGRRASSPGRRWRVFLWSLVYPRQGSRLLLTLPGLLVIAVALGIAAAAYNTSNNILFIALSLLLACLVFSGLLLWLNLRNLAWRLRVRTPLRAGREHPATVELHNRKKLLPVYGVWFEVVATGDKHPIRLPLRERLDPGEVASLEWTLRPAARGRHRIEVRSATSLFPFGFLKKIIGGELRRDVLVWPAPVDYRRFPTKSWHQPGQVERSSRAGPGGDLLALRSYVRGDSHRLVHWKATARLRRLMVRQHAAETQTGYSLWVRTAAADWPRADQFERMCGLAATLAEDLFREGRLMTVAFDDEAPLPVRRLADLERFLDRLALIQPSAGAPAAGALVATARRANVLTLAPDGARGVLAHLDGEQAASA